MMLKLGKAAVAGLVALGVAVFVGGLLTYVTLIRQQTKSEQDSGKSGIPQSAPLHLVTMTEAGPMQETAKTDLDRLQGVWSVVSMEQGGKPVKLNETVFMVDGKRACWQSSDFEMPGGLYLEPTSKPKAYDLAMSMRTMEGIYALDGDTLRLCYDMGNDPKRPGRFLTEKGSQQVLVVLKQTAGKDVFPYRLADGSRAWPLIVKKTEMAPPAIAPQPIKAAKKTKAGRIFVVGNTKAETSLILIKDDPAQTR